MSKYSPPDRSAAGSLDGSLALDALRVPPTESVEERAELEKDFSAMEFVNGLVGEVAQEQEITLGVDEDEDISAGPDPDLEQDLAPELDQDQDGDSRRTGKKARRRGRAKGFSFLRRGKDIFSRIIGFLARMLRKLVISLVPSNRPSPLRSIARKFREKREKRRASRN